MQAQWGIGIALWRSGEIVDGIARLEKAVSDYSNNVMLRLELVRALLFAELYSEAEKHVKIASKLEPGNGVVYHIYTEILLAQGLIDHAVKMADKTIKMGCPLSSELKAKISRITIK